MWEKKETREGSWSGLAKPAFKYKLPESTTAASITICSFLPRLAKQQNENHNDPLLALHIQKQKSHHRRQSATSMWWSAESTISWKCDQWSFEQASETWFTYSQIFVPALLLLTGASMPVRRISIGGIRMPRWMPHELSCLVGWPPSVVDKSNTVITRN